MKRKIMSVVAVAAFGVGLAVPLMAKADEYGSYLECLRHCAGSCTFSGVCYLKEK